MSSFENTEFSLWIPDMDPKYKDNLVCRQFILADETVDIYVLMRTKNGSKINKQYKQDLTSLHVILYLIPQNSNTNIPTVSFEPIYIKDSVFPAQFIDDIEDKKCLPEWLLSLIPTESVVGFICSHLKVSIPSIYYNTLLTFTAVISPCPKLFSSQQVQYHYQTLPPSLPYDKTESLASYTTFQTLFTFKDIDTTGTTELTMPLVIIEPLRITCSGSGLNATLNIENISENMEIYYESISATISHVDKLTSQNESDDVIIETMAPKSHLTNYNYLTLSTSTPNLPTLLKPSTIQSTIIYLDEDSSSILSKDLKPYGGYMHVYCNIKYMQLSLQNPITKSIFLRYYVHPLSILLIHMDIPKQIYLNSVNSVVIHLFNNTEQTIQDINVSFDNGTAAINFIFVSPTQYMIPEILPKHTYDLNLNLSILQKGIFSFPHFHIFDNYGQQYSYNSDLPSVTCI